MRLRELIDDEEYIKEKRALLAEKASLETNQSDLGRKSRIDLAQETFIFAAEALSRYQNGTLEDKRLILQNLGSNFFQKQNTRYSSQKPFHIIEGDFNTMMMEILRSNPGITALNLTIPSVALLILNPGALGRMRLQVNFLTEISRRPPLAVLAFSASRKNSHIAAGFESSTQAKSRKSSRGIDRATRFSRSRFVNYDRLISFNEDNGIPKL
jgi:hypothetical protein